MMRNLRSSVEKADELFKYLHEEAAKFKTSTNVANLPNNRRLNRWHNVLPADDTRVVLNPPFMSTDYINANHVIVPEAKRAYILTQGPLPETVGHFWTMVWQQKSKAIIMLCKTVESGLCKCAHYWPRNTSPIMGTAAEPLTIHESGLKVKLLETTQDEASETRIRVMELTSNEESKRIVTQYHFQKWPDFGVPETPDSFLNFLKLISSEHPSKAESPNIVHCSAGIGRSGTLCLVDSCLEKMALSGKLMEESDVLDMLLEMRKQRDGLVQTTDQLRFAFSAISDAMQSQNQSEPTPDSPSAKSVTFSENAESASAVNGNADVKPNGINGGEKLGRKRSTDFASSDTTINISKIESESDKSENMAKRKRDC